MRVGPPDQDGEGRAENQIVRARRSFAVEWLCASLVLRHGVSFCLFFSSCFMFHSRTPFSCSFQFNGSCREGTTLARQPIFRFFLLLPLVCGGWGRRGRKVPLLPVRNPLALAAFSPRAGGLKRCRGACLRAAVLPVFYTTGGGTPRFYWLDFFTLLSCCFCFFPSTGSLLPASPRGAQPERALLFFRG